MTALSSLRFAACLALAVPISAAACVGSSVAVPTVSTPQATATQAAPSEAALMDEDAVAYAVLSNTCQGCHDLGMLARRPISAQEWPGLLDKMAGLGANLSDGERQTLLRYLTRIYSSDPAPESTKQP
jgi:hypothetical protein